MSSNIQGSEAYRNFVAEGGAAQAQAQAQAQLSIEKIKLGGRLLMFFGLLVLLICLCVSGATIAWKWIDSRTAAESETGDGGGVLTSSILPFRKQTDAKIEQLQTEVYALKQRVTVLEAIPPAVPGKRPTGSTGSVTPEANRGAKSP
jgi:hypothetical protein